jgi:hypothetical protein
MPPLTHCDACGSVPGRDSINGIARDSISGIAQSGAFMRMRGVAQETLKIMQSLL